MGRFLLIGALAAAAFLILTDNQPETTTLPLDGGGAEPGSTTGSVENVNE